VFSQRISTKSPSAHSAQQNHNNKCKWAKAKYKKVHLRVAHFQTLLQHNRSSSFQFVGGVCPVLASCKSLPWFTWARCARQQGPGGHPAQGPCWRSLSYSNYLFFLRITFHNNSHQNHHIELDHSQTRKLQERVGSITKKCNRGWDHIRMSAQCIHDTPW